MNEPNDVTPAINNNFLNMLQVHRDGGAISELSDAIPALVRENIMAEVKLVAEKTGIMPLLGERYGS